MVMVLTQEQVIVIWIYGQITRDNNGKWSEPQLLPNSINSKDNEGPSVLSPQGDEIYLARCPRMKKVDLGCEIFLFKTR